MLALGCRSSKSQAEADPTSHVTPASPATIEVAIHGCNVIVKPEGRRCLLGDSKTVSLWLPGLGDAKVDLRLDGAPLESRDTVDRDGRILQVEVPDSGGQLELELGSALWSVELAPLSQRYRELTERLIALEGDKRDEARALLRAQLGELEPDEAAASQCLYARLTYGTDELPALVDALADTQAVGCLGTALVVSAYTQIYGDRDFNAIQRSLDAARVVQRHDFGIYVSVIYLQAALDRWVGNIDKALDGYQRVVRLAGLIDDTNLLESAQVMQGVALSRLGRFEEAEQLITQIEAALDGGDANSNVAVTIRDNLAWIALLRREDDPSAPDPTATLEQLLGIYTQRDNPQDVARMHLHLALANIQASALDPTAAQLDAIDRAQLGPGELVWLELIASRLARGRSHPDQAGEHLERAELFAELGEDLELAWYVWVAKATLERAQGHRDAALAAHQRAAGLADQLALSVSGTAGRSIAVTSRSRVDAEHIELLLDAGRSQQALCVTAGARARHLRSLWARLRPPLTAAAQHDYQELLSRYEQRHRAIEAQLGEAWSLSKVELARLRDRLRAEGEQADELLERATALLERDAPQWSCERILPRDPASALLTMSADPKLERWWFMLARADRDPIVVTLADRPPVELAREALARLDPELEGLSALVVIPVAEFVAVDFHQLALERAPLRALTLRYSLGLGDGDGDDDETRLAPRAPMHAAVINGANNLDAVAREAATVTQQLRDLDWTVAPSWSPTAADQPALLHYSGHGHHVGLAGWGSYLEVPGLGQVTAAQIVAAQRAPELVVLGACSAGSFDAEIIDGGMNLAAAFVLAGANLVVAPSGPVDDDTALALGSALYRGLDSPDPNALVNELTSIQRRELDDDPQAAGPRSTLRWRAWTP